MTTDSYGNIFVASYGEEGTEKTGGRIDIFTSSGFYVGEIPDSDGPKSLAVDSKENLYVFDFRSATSSSSAVSKIVRYEPTVNEPTTGEIAYGEPTLVDDLAPAFMVGLAINTVNDHLFANLTSHVNEYDSAAEGNDLIDETIGNGSLSGLNGLGMAVDATHKLIYASSNQAIKVFELESPHALVRTIDGSATPKEEHFANQISVAVDEGTGHVFVYNAGGPGANVVYEFTEDGKYVSTIEHGFQALFGTDIEVDNGKNSPNGALNPFGRFLYIPSHPSGTGHSFAFGPPEPDAPQVESLSFEGITESEARLQANIKPEFLDTTYTFEYTTKEAFESETEKFENGKIAGSGLIPAGEAPVEVSVTVGGLEPGTTFVFRVVAENEKGLAQEEGEFSTYSTEELEPVLCPNKSFRIGSSGLLPDCRVYELVTPPDTNARAPIGQGHLGGPSFGSPEASPAGDKVSFQIEGGALPGTGATGSLGGDPYLVHRSQSGWSTSYIGPSGDESPAVLPGSASPDQEFLFWSTGSAEGSAAVGGNFTGYLRYPDGHFALVGRGTIGTDPRAQGKLISEGGTHVIFFSGGSFPAIQIEENAPPSGTWAVYDRTIDPATGVEQTHVISLLPEDKTPAAGENALYEGASLNGKAVAFKIGSTLYFRYNNEETYEVGENVTFAGFAREGRRAFYVQGGNLFAFDVDLHEAGEGPVQFSSSGNVTPINVASNGSVAYFISPSILVGEPNPAGDLPAGGGQNLYRSEEGTLSFVGTVTKEDVTGEENGVGLGNWAPHVVSFGEAAEDPSRTTPDGQVLVFESEAALTGFDPEGHTEIYRYDSVSNQLDCLSCAPTLAPAVGDASLQSVGFVEGDPEPLNPFALVANLRTDGRRVFFQSTDPLVLGDTDKLQDVYEWEVQGVGSCTRLEGCIYLISSGQSRRIDYLWAVSDSGNDVFFRSSDLLVGSDSDETPSIYDARVNGGFAGEPEKACEGEGCRSTLLPAPPMLLPESGVNRVSSQVRSCPKGKRKVVRNGKTVCVKKHKKHKKHHRRTGKKMKGAGK